MCLKRGDLYLPSSFASYGPLFFSLIFEFNFYSFQLITLKPTALIKMTLAFIIAPVFGPVCTSVCVYVRIAQCERNRFLQMK